MPSRRSFQSIKSDIAALAGHDLSQDNYPFPLLLLLLVLLQVNKGRYNKSWTRGERLVKMSSISSIDRPGREFPETASFSGLLETKRYPFPSSVLHCHLKL